MTNAIRDARLRIDLDTQDAEARIDALEEKMKDIQDDIDDGGDDADAVAQKHQSAVRKGSKTNQFHEGGMKPGRFGMHIPSPAAGLGAIPVIGPVINKAMDVAPAAAGLFDSADKWWSAHMAQKNKESSQPGNWRDRLGVRNLYGKQMSELSHGVSDHGSSGDVLMALQKAAVQADLHAKALGGAQDRILEYVRGAAMTGGHLDVKNLTRFAQTAYQWEFVQARKDRDMHDKSMRILTQQAPGLLKDLAMSFMKGIIAP